MSTHVGAVIDFFCQAIEPLNTLDRDHRRFPLRNRSLLRFEDEVGSLTHRELRFATRGTFPRGLKVTSTPRRMQCRAYHQPRHRGPPPKRQPLWVFHVTDCLPIAI